MATRQQFTEPEPALRSQAVLRRVARAQGREGERDFAMFAEASKFDPDFKKLVSTDGRECRSSELVLVGQGSIQSLGFSIEDE
jgi:hypothetical protein